MATSDSKLYSYENDYKEQHAKHIKRPALVTIKKPVISKGEMEDVLMRLLNLHVNPVQGEFKFNGVTRGVGNKAYLVDYHKRAINDRVVSPNDDQGTRDFIKRSVYEIGSNENVIVYTDWLNLVGADQNPFDCTALMTPDRVSAHINTVSQNARSKTYGDRGFTMHVSHSPVQDAYNGWFDPEQVETVFTTEVDDPYAVKYSLYLLSRSDHLYLKMDTKTQKSQLSGLVKNPELFTANGFMRYVGTSAIFDPKDPNGISHPLNEQMAKKSFGFIPQNKVNAYEWVFYTKPLTKVFIGDTRVLENFLPPKNEFVQNEVADRLFEELKSQLTTLFKQCQSPTTVQGLYPTISGEYTRAYNTTATLLGWGYNFTPKDSLNYCPTKTTFCKLIKEYAKSLNKADEEAKKRDLMGGTVYTVTRPIANIGNFILDKLPSLTPSFTASNPVEGTGALMIKCVELYESIVSGANPLYDVFVPLLDTSASRRKRDEEDAKRNTVKRILVTTNSDASITIGEFKLQYYAILLQSVNKKYESLKPFIDSGIVRFPLQDDLDAVNAFLQERQRNNTASSATVADIGSAELQDFIDRAERILYSIFSGFYISSYSADLDEVKADTLWNAAADTTNFKAVLNDVDFGEEWKYRLLDLQNKDISNISISRAVQGRSTATVLIKNNKQKYNYDRSDVLQRNSFIIEPLDEIIIYLPTIEFTKSGGIPNYSGHLEQVFAGVVSNCTDENRAGYHSIRVLCECTKKYMDIVRTNVKPSASREENLNNAITAFIVPEKLYESVEQWMPFMFAQAMSYIHCQLRKTTEADLQTPLFTVTRTAIRAPQYVRINRTGTETITTSKTETQPAYYKITEPIVSVTQYGDTNIAEAITNPIYGAEYIKARGQRISAEEYATATTTNPSGTVFQSATTMTTYHKLEEETEVEYSYDIEVVTEEYAQRTLTVGYYDKVSFDSDPLLGYLWYKANSKQLPTSEQQIIRESLKLVLEDYVVTRKVKDGQITDVPGVADLKTLLRQGYRASYFVYKQRFDGLTLPNMKDRVIVAKITGTSQPTYLLQSSALSIQFSNWKSNGQIINDIASRFNFLYYSDKNGIVNFTPYTLDLTTLNTNNYRNSYIDTDKMLITRSSRDIENDDNPQILKQQYLTEFTSTIRDSEIVNWVKMSGNFQVKNGADGVDKALVIDPVLIKRFGYRPAKQVNIMGIQNAESLRLYGLAWMDRQNKRYLSASASGLFDSRMDINLPYYVPTAETIYYCEGLRISYVPGDTCTFNMDLTFGKKPLMSIEDYAISMPSNVTDVLREEQHPGIQGAYVLDPTHGANGTLLDNLSTLFTKENAIKPTTYAQYKTLFDAEEEDYIKYTKNAAICCYNGYLWDNVAALSFEELVYNYGFLNAGAVGAGFTTALSADGSSPFMQKVAEVYDRVGNDLSVSSSVQNAIDLYCIDIPSIKQTNKLPEQFNTISGLISDLNVPGVINAYSLYSRNANKSNNAKQNK